MVAMKPLLSVGLFTLCFASSIASENESHRQTNERQFKTKSGLQVYEIGNGFPLIILPGGPGFSSLVYRQQLQSLATHSKLIFWDYRGTGLSDGFKDFG